MTSSNSWPPNQSSTAHGSRLTALATGALPKVLASLLLLLLSAFPGHVCARDWKHMPGTAHDVADGWVIGTNSVDGGYGIWRWDGSDWKPIPGGAVRIGGTRETPWVVNNKNQIYRWSGSDWKHMPGTARDVADDWIIGTNSVDGGYGIRRRDGSDWKPVPGGAMHIGGTRRTPWVVNNNNKIYRWRGGGRD